MSSRANSEKVGLFDGFEGYQTASDQDLKQVLTRGLVVLDTNVLLNLYRYTSTTRADLFEVLNKIGDQLWIPHQALEEFWRNRDNTIRDPQIAGDKAITELEAELEESLRIIRTWSNRIALAESVTTEMSNRLDNAFMDVSAMIKEVADRESSKLSQATHNDPVLQGLAPIISGRRGHPFSADVKEELVREAVYRAENFIPPGYKDHAKTKKEGGETRAAGDYLLWEQVLREAETRKTDVLLVTGDVKEDWWRKDHGKTRGPRLELVQEMKERTGRRLLMLRPESLLLHAKDLLSIEVSAASVEDITRVDKYLAKENNDEWTDDQSEESDDSLVGPGERHLLDKLPEGRTGDYLDIVADMAALVKEAPQLETYLDSFQKRFPSITLRSVARRRMRVLVSLGLAHIQSGQVKLTDLGERLVTEKSISIVQKCLIDRIAGAAEILELSKNNDPENVRLLVRQEPPSGLSTTQAQLVYRWLHKFELIQTE